MDAKSLAKSKRAHSQHHSKKHHPNPKSKANATSTSTTSDSNAKKSSGDRPPKSHSSSPRLPSNWDRYEDEFELNPEAVSVDQSAKASDVVLPKSKGADFGWLISEAQSQMESQSSVGTLGNSPFDDALPDFFHQGLCSMLTVRGNSMLSWMVNDNFIVDDSSVTGDEASFLSLDLHAVASQLEKLDISQRLFIEADILPSQLDMNDSKETIKPEPEQSKSCASGAAEQFLDESAILEHSNDNTMCVPSNATSSRSSLPTPQPVKDDSIQIERYEVNDAKIPKDESSSIFEASAAEAELDMLLNSLGEVNLDSPGKNKRTVNILPTSQWDDSPMLSKQPSDQGFNSSKSSAVMNIDLDDTIDDLLRKTSNIKNQNSAVHPQGPVTPPFTATSSTNSTAVLDDFDSWLETL